MISKESIPAAFSNLNHDAAAAIACHILFTISDSSDIYIDIAPRLRPLVKALDMLTTEEVAQVAIALTQQVTKPLLQASKKTRTKQLSVEQLLIMGE